MDGCGDVQIQRDNALVIVQECVPGRWSFVGRPAVEGGMSFGDKRTAVLVHAEGDDICLALLGVGSRARRDWYIINGQSRRQIPRENIAEVFLTEALRGAAGVQVQIGVPTLRTAGVVALSIYGEVRRELPSGQSQVTILADSDVVLARRHPGDSAETACISLVIEEVSQPPPPAALPAKRPSSDSGAQGGEATKRTRLGAFKR